MIAELMKENRYAQIRFAHSRKDVWPGYHESLPLGKVGYWVGTYGRHRWVETLDEAERIIYSEAP